MALFFCPDGPRPMAVLLFAALALACSAQEAADAPTSVLDTADRDTTAVLASEPSEFVHKVIQSEATATATATLVAAPAAVARTLEFEAPAAAAVKAPIASASEDVSSLATAASRKLTAEETAASRKLLVEDGQAKNLVVQLEALLTGLEDARAVGGIASLPKGEEEAVKLARAVLANAMDAPKVCQSAWQRKQAFELGRRARVPDAELDKIWVDLRSDMMSTLSEAMKAAKKTCTQQTLQDLAAALCIWRKLHFCHKMKMVDHSAMEPEDDRMLVEAKALFRSSMKDARGHEDFDLAKVAVELQGEAGAGSEPLVQEWVDVMHKLNCVADVDETPVDELLSIAERARVAAVSRTQKLKDVEAAAQNKLVAELEVLEGSDKLKPILDNLGKAKRAGVDTAEVRNAEKSARAMALALLQQNQACPDGSDSVPPRKEAFEQARQLGGLDDEIANSWNALKSDCQMRLVSATAGAKRRLQETTNSTVADAQTGGRSLEQSAESPESALQRLQTLANGCLLWRKFGFQAGDTLSKAQGVFEENAEAAFDRKDLEYVAAASRLADQCSVRLKPVLHQWRQVSERLAGAAAALDEQRVQVLLDLIRQSSSIQLPPSQYSKAVEEKVSELTAADLTQALSNADTTVEALLAAVENAGAVCSVASSSVCSTELHKDIASAQTKVRQMALGQLIKVLDEKATLESVPAIKQAIELARRCGVPEDERSKAWAKLQQHIQAQLIQATVAAEAADSGSSGSSGSSSSSSGSGSVSGSSDGNNRRLDTTASSSSGSASSSSNGLWNEEAIKDLADVLFVARKMATPAKDSEVMINANRVYTRQLQASFEAQDTTLTVQAVQLAGQAGVKCSPTIARFAAVAGRVKQAAKELELQTPEQGRRLGQTSQASSPNPALVALVREAHETKHPLTAELKLIEDAARNAVAAEMEKAMQL